MLHALISLALLAFVVAGGYRFEYVAILIFWAVLTAVGPRARRFLSIAVPVLLVGVLYDKILPILSQYRPEVHVADLYRTEKHLFGIATAGGVEIPSEWLSRHTSAILDVASGFVYIAFMYESFLAAAWLYFVDEARAAPFTWAFLLCNLIGMTGELVFPAAPPWYVRQYGLGPAHLEAVASAAGAARFDALFGIHYFAAFYARSKDVFGAMPSLHVAYPVLVLLAVWSSGPRWLRVAAAAFAVVMAFAAVYLEHHYVLDVLAGAAAGTLAYLAVFHGTRALRRARGAVPVA